MQANYLTDQQKFTDYMFNIKLEQKSYKISFKALLAKIQLSNNRQYAPHLPPLLRQIGLSELKSYFITSFALSLIMISILALLECITHSSSLLSMKEIKLFAIVN